MKMAARKIEESFSQKLDFRLRNIRLASSKETTGNQLYHFFKNDILSAAL